MASVIQWFRGAYNRRFIRYGAPFLILIVGGSFGLEKFTSIRYQFRSGTKLTPEEAEKYGIRHQMKERAVSLESEYQEYQDRDLDSWENIRGPRPWEDSKTIQDSQRKKIS